MNDDNTTTPYTTLIVVGASGRIGREVARLGVAYGARVIGICRDGKPPNQEPWTQGVEWLALDFTEPGVMDGLRAHAVVVAAPTAVDPSVFEQFERVIVVREDGTAPQSSPPASLILATAPRVDDSPLDDDGYVVLNEDAIRVETLGMALLRAALDDGIQPLLGPEELMRLGDAVMLQ